ncbi:DUF6631 family protein [Lysobacter sp. CA199]|uniref:DUF6631 family protein n=1 Tax=Lysobacter sp. CA199 TaxID=3455608 RepID=UPI003F8CFB6A
MAKKIEKPQPQSAPEGADTAGVEELGVLYPERTLTIGNEKVVVNEIGFVQSLMLHDHVSPIVAAIEALMTASNEAPDFLQVTKVFATNRAATIELLMAATGKDAAWLNGLNAVQGHQLLLIFWGTNADFFIQSAMNELAIRREQARLSAGARSTQPSSPTDTGPTNSGGTPPAS